MSLYPVASGPLWVACGPGWGKSGVPCSSDKRHPQQYPARQVCQHQAHDGRPASVTLAQPSGHCSLGGCAHCPGVCPRWLHPEVVLHTPLYPRPASPLLVSPQQRRGRSWDGRSLHNSVSAMTAGRRLLCRPRRPHRPLLHPHAGSVRSTGAVRSASPLDGAAQTLMRAPAAGHCHRRHRLRGRCSPGRTRAGRGAPTRWPPPPPGSRRASPAHGVGAEPLSSVEDQGQRPRSRSSGPRHIRQRPPSLRPGRLLTGSVAFGSEPSRAPLPTRALLALTEPQQCAVARCPTRMHLQNRRPQLRGTIRSLVSPWRSHSF